MSGVISKCFALSPVESLRLFPKLCELTAMVYARLKDNARGNWGRETALGLRKFLVICLLHEERFAQLIAADERLHGTEPVEEILNFPVLVDALRRTKRRRAEDLKRAGIGDPVALKAFGLFAVEHGEDDTAGAQKFGEAGNTLFGDRGLEIVEKVPKQNGIE